MRGNEIILDKPIRCYDNGGKTFDRYTVAFMNRKDWGYNDSNRSRGQLLYPSLGMSDSPTHPQGFGQHGDCVLGPHLGRRIQFSSLPEECQKMVRRDLTEDEDPPNPERARHDNEEDWWEGA